MLALRRVITAAAKAGVGVLTVYAFSEENWGRERSEVGALLDLGTAFARREGEALAREDVRVRVIGRRDRLPAAMREAFARLETRTAGCGGMTLNVSRPKSPRAASTPKRSMKKRSPGRCRPRDSPTRTC